jgi:TusA-related sulfurtransferase
VSRWLDLRGKICPWTTLDTKMALMEMAVGEVLEVLCDYYPARQTIPNMMRDLGFPCRLFDGDEPEFRFRIYRTDDNKGGE